MSSSQFIGAGSVRHSLAESRSEESCRAASASDSGQDWRDAILLGDSVAIRRLRSQIQRIAPYFRIALIRGETGSGKQLVGRAIHALSAGSDGPFIVTTASALAESVAGSEASHREPATESVFESACGGTLYLDRIGELSYTLQAALFRFLCVCNDRRAGVPQGGRTGFRGSARPRADTRILAASSRDLRALSAIGQFRHDLYARLSVVEIFVPPLRQRVEDLAILAGSLLRRLAEQTGESPKLLAGSTLVQLQNRLWPDNFRELGRVVAEAAALAEGAIVEPRHLLALNEAARANAAAPPTAQMERLDVVIQQHVLEVLVRCGGNKLRAAALLGISRSTLYRMLDTTAACTHPAMEREQ